MKYFEPLLEGICELREKRFFAHIRNKANEKMTLHVPNTGSLKTAYVPQQKCRYSLSNNPERKLKGTLEMLQTADGVWVGVNTQMPNRIVKEALVEKLLPHWHQWTEIKPEFKYTKETRFDFCLSDGKNKHLIEVKNVTYCENGIAQFPDAESTRAQKHLRELMRAIDEGYSAEVVFTVQRNDAKSFSPQKQIDPEYARLYFEAIKKGVRMTPLIVILNAEEIRLTNSQLAGLCDS